LKEDGKIDWDKLRADMSKHEPQEKIDEIYNKCKDVGKYDINLIRGKINFYPLKN